MFNVASSRDYYQKKEENMKNLGENMMASVLYTI